MRVGVPFGLDEVEVEGHVGAAEVGGVGIEAVVGDEIAEGEIDLADEDALVGYEAMRACISATICVGLGAVGGVEGEDAARSGEPSGSSRGWEGCRGTGRP